MNRDFFCTRNLPIFLILLLALFVRVWNLKQLLFFTLDEEIEAFIVKNIVTGFHYPAIGISVAPVGIHLSPLFYFLAALPFGLGNLNPLVWGYTSVLIGVFTTWFLYYATKNMFSKNLGLIAALLYASSFLMVMYDKHFWNVTPMPLIAIVTIYSLYQLIHKKYWWAIPLFLVLALGISSHMSAAILIILTIIVWIRDKISIKQKPVILGVVIFFLSQLPLLVFELRHNFLQTQALGKFFTGEHSGFDPMRIWNNLLLYPKVFSRLIYTFGPHDYAYEHTYGAIPIADRDRRIPIIMLLTSLVLTIGFIYITIKNWKSHSLKLHLSLILLTIIGLIVYGTLLKGNLFEFYLSILFPSIFVVMAVIIDKLSNGLKKYLVWGVVLVLVIANIHASLTATHSFGLSKKLQIIEWVKVQVGWNDYALHSIGVDKKYEGYRYLFERFYKSPTNSYVDPQLAWLYQTPVSQKVPKFMVVVSTNEKGYEEKINKEKNLYIPSKISEIQVEDINAMIIDTTKIKN